MAEAKFRANEAAYSALIEARDAEGIMDALTDRAVELKVRTGAPVLRPKPYSSFVTSLARRLRPWPQSEGDALPFITQLRFEPRTRGATPL